MIPVALIYLFLLPCMWIEKEAKETANKERGKIVSGIKDKATFPSQPRVVLYIKNESKSFDQYSGHLINTSATYYALYNKAKGVSVFPVTSVSRMIVHECTVQDNVPQTEHLH